MLSSKNTISVIVPVRNGGTWIEKCFNSILEQTATNAVDLEVCVCNDASTDDTLKQLQSWKIIFENHSIGFKLYNNDKNPGGVGYSKNRAVELSTGEYLCFQDIDDVMLPDRILQQYLLAIKTSEDTLIGCQFRREPENSTARYTKWANNLTEKELYLQIYTSNGPTIIMPTWFCNRKIYDRIGGFVENDSGTPEDLIFFYKHLDFGGKLARIDECLLIYTYHPKATTFSIHEDTIWRIRLERLEKLVLSNWSKFTIWNAGKQGRKLYNSLSIENKAKVIAFCDVDINKIGKKYEFYDADKRVTSKPVNIIHFKEASPPFIICIKIDLTNGIFEDNLRSLNLNEGTDYVLFS